MAIVDVTNPAAPVFISETTYPASNSNYAHQGWLTPDGRHVLINDEFDNASTGTRSILMNVTDLDDPTHIGSYYGSTGMKTYAHNLYIRGEYAFLSNYTGGLHVLDISSRNPATFTEVGFFDTYTNNNNVSYNGQWHNYPFFASGNVITTDISNGLFILRTPGITTATEGTPQTGFSLSPATPNPASGVTQLTLTVDHAQQVRAEAFDALGRRVAVVFEGAVVAAAPTALVFDATDLPAGAYVVRVTGEGFVSNTRVTVAH
ncbi:MAG TPA: choice-of-anchor B family protein, partial [Rhodothermales bacterium]|nr:choice-of-anchor B family protein [Rhodothermales bacterium]